MSVARLSGVVVDRYLSLVKVPLDAVARRTRPDPNASTSPAELLLDRVDATTREALGRLLGDETLQDDARRRRVAAAERERALRLKAEAEELTVEADHEFANRQKAAAERRQHAEQRATEEKQRIDQERRDKEREVEQVAAQRKAASRKIASTVEGAVDDKADRARLVQLETEAEALQDEEQALTAKAAAKQVSAAAGKAKAARKGES
jgi:hypothetical protein